MKEIIACTNCGKQTEGNYCSDCGQKKFSRNQFEFRKFAKDILADFFDLDSEIVTTVKTLFLNPGKLTTDYLNGKQKSYIGPVKLYLTIITINFLVYSYMEDYSLVNIEFLQDLSSKSFWIYEKINSSAIAANIPLKEYYHQVNSKVNETLPIILYILIFIQALVLKIEFHKSKRYYMEHLVFSLHFMSFGFLRDVLLLPVQLYNQHVGFVISIITTITYLFFALKKAYNIKGSKLILHTFIQYGIFLLFFTLSIIASVVLAL